MKEPLDPMTLPGFAEVKERLEAEGSPSYWIARVVDPNSSCAVFLPNGGHWYKSGCPLYEGYWLDGGTGAVQCTGYGELLPGLMWGTTCEKKFETCPFYKDGQVQLSLFT